jgi:hypothetical protein
VPDPNPKYDVDVQWPTAMLRGIIDHFRIDPGIRLVGPAAIEAVFHQRDGEIIVHLLNRSHDVPGLHAAPVHDAEIYVDRDLAEIDSARIVYPREGKLPVQPSETGVSMPVPPVEMHSILVLHRLTLKRSS